MILNGDFRLFDSALNFLKFKQTVQTPRWVGGVDGAAGNLLYMA